MHKWSLYIDLVQQSLIFVLYYLILAYELTGLSKGGQQVNNCAQTFNKALKLLVELASLQVQLDVSVENVV